MDKQHTISLSLLYLFVDRQIKWNKCAGDAAVRVYQFDFYFIFKTDERPLQNLDEKPKITQRDYHM